MPSKPRHHFVDARIVLHGAAAQRIHAEIDGVVPSREPREVADDFNLAHFRQQRPDLRVPLRPAASCGVDCGNVERRQPIGLLARRGLLEDQAFILTDVAGHLASVRRQRECCRFDAGRVRVVPWFLYAISFIRLSRSARCGRFVFCEHAAAASICARVFCSVAHHSEALPSSGYHLASGRAANHLLLQQARVALGRALRRSPTQIR